MNEYFEERLRYLRKKHKELLAKKNTREKSVNGIYNRYENPVLTAAAHAS